MRLYRQSLHACTFWYFYKLYMCVCVCVCKQFAKREKLYYLYLIIVNNVRYIY